MAVIKDDPLLWLEMRIAVPIDGPPSAVRQYEGRIVTDVEAPDNYKEATAGWVDAYVVDLADPDALLECDAQDGDLFHAIESVYDSQETYKPSLDLEAPYTTALYVHEIKLLPRYRGRGYGLLIMRRLLQVLGGRCDVALAIPAPLQKRDRQGDSEMDYELFDLEQGEAKLRSYWSRLGFRRVERTDVYYLDLGKALS